MKNLKVSKVLAALMLGGMLSLTVVPAVYAVETAHGVAEFTQKSLDSAKAALEHAKAGHKAETLTSLKEIRQYTKEITGDAAGKKLQDANKHIKEAINAVDANDLNAAAEHLNVAIPMLDEINTRTKSK